MAWGTPKSRSVCAGLLGEAAARNGASKLLRIPRFHAGRLTMQDSTAGIDVHKRVLMVVVSRDEDERLVRGRFGATSQELPPQIPGIRTLSAQQIVAEASPQASAFDSAAQFSSWIGVSPSRGPPQEQHLRAEIPPLVAPPWLRQGHLGHCPASQRGDLDGPAPGRFLHRIQIENNSAGSQTTLATTEKRTARPWLSRHPHTLIR